MVVDHLYIYSISVRLLSNRVFVKEILELHKKWGPGAKPQWEWRYGVRRRQKLKHIASILENL